MAMIKLETPECVSSLRLFGSAFRSELDELSDIDVLAVYSRLPSDEDRERLFLNLKQAYGPSIEVAEYQERRIRDFFKSGHLFAWHLKIESVSISSRDDEFFGSLPPPAPYVWAAEDAMQFHGLATGVLESVQQGGSAVIFEMGILYVASRNFAMCLSAAHGREPIFSRYAPYLLDQTFAFPLKRDQYDQLITCRKASTKGIPNRQVSEGEALSLACKVVDWMTRSSGELQ